MTRIVIAHRPETILNAERIMQLQQGQLQDITAAYKAQFGIGTADNS
ncbi:ATPase [Alishewanella longhuensis]